MLFTISSILVSTHRAHSAIFMQITISANIQLFPMYTYQEITQVPQISLSVLWSLQSFKFSSFLLQDVFSVIKIMFSY